MASRKEYQAKYYQEHREQAKRNHEEYYRLNRIQISKKKKEYHDRNKKYITERQKIYKASPEGRYRIYKSSAKARDLSFDLTFEQFLSFWQLPCSYCGDPISTIGLDRIDNTKGYTIENTITCCWPCNEFKSNYEIQEFIDRCNKISNHYKPI